MAADPSFAATPKAGAVLTNATADTSRTAPTNVATVYTAGANGSKIEQIRINQILTTTAGGTIIIFLYDGTTHHMLDYYQYGVLTLSATANGAPIDLYYPTLVIPATWTIRVTNTVASGTGSTAATHKVCAFGGDF